MRTPTVLLRAGAAVLAAAAGLFLLVVVGQRRLLYFPDRYAADAAAARAARLGLEPWPGPDERLGWRAPHPSGRPVATWIVLHGNAGSALDRTYLRDVLQAPTAPPADVILLEYPGYGARPGAPSEASLVRAAVTAIDRARAGGAPVLLAGESLGSAVAALAAARRPDAVRGVLLVTPLASVPAVARRHYPLVPAFLVRDRLRADRALPRFPGRTAFVVAGRDEVAFADLGLALHAAQPGEKRLWVQPEATHNGLRYDPRDPEWGELARFLAGDAGGAP